MSAHCCHPERSEGPHNLASIARAILYDQSPCGRSLVVCATRDDMVRTLRR